MWYYNIMNNELLKKIKKKGEKKGRGCNKKK
jgi:hypothetical protein